MRNKVKLLFLLMLSLFVLSACSAKVHTETSFNRDGSGNRMVYLNIANKDEEKIRGGFEGLEKALKEKAPSCMEVKRYENKDKTVTIFELKYEFVDIKDFKEKTKEVIGEEPVFKWEDRKGAFQGRCSYSDDTTTEQLMKWVEDAFEENGMKGFLFSNLYEEEESKVLYDGDVVWTGIGKSTFTVDKTPVIEEVSVYTNVLESGRETKQVKLGFSYDDYKEMNTEEGLTYLHQFSEEFKVDGTCNGYSVTLDSHKKLKAFLEKSSGSIQNDIPYESLKIEPLDKNYYCFMKMADSIYSDNFTITEVYNLNELLKGFRVSAKTIKDYVSIPKRASYTSEQVHHTFALESNDAYRYIGEYDIQDTYYMYFSGGKSVQLKDAKVSFSVDENLIGLQTVRLDIAKNGMHLTSNDVMKYYSALGEKVQYEEEGNNIRITFLKEMKLGENSDKDGIRKIHGISLHKIKYEMRSALLLKNYYPVDKQEIVCSISLPSSMEAEHIRLGDKTLTKKEIRAGKGKKQWTCKVPISDQKEIMVEVDFSCNNLMFDGILAIGILLVAGGGLSIYFTFYKGKGCHNLNK